MKIAPRPGPPAGEGQVVGLARALSKLGYCSRREGWELVRAGRVQLNGRVVRDPERPTRWRSDRIEVDKQPVRAEAKLYLALNKPRGVVTTTSDEKGRDTVYRCFQGASLPFVSPVGRLDQASEGLLLFTNDTAWGARTTAPESRLKKVYHVQIDCLADDALLHRMQQGVQDADDFLTAREVRVLRRGTSNSWLEVVLDEGRNRHIRRLLAAFGIGVLRLVRVAIGSLPLGNLPKGGFRHLSEEEVSKLAAAAGGGP